MVSSLQNICGVPVVVVLANHPDVKKQIFSSSEKKVYQNSYEIDLWENAINEETSKILKDYNSVLKSIFPRLKIKFVGMEMLKLAENLQRLFGLSTKFTENFIKSSLFTSKGFIDVDKAASELVKEQSLSLLLKYKIACHFCLEGIVPNLWHELRNNEPNFKKILSELGSETPMVMWSDYLEERKSTSVKDRPFLTRKFRAKVFSYGIENKNAAAVKFSLGSVGKFRKSKEERNRETELINKSFINCITCMSKFLKPPFSCFMSENFGACYNLIECFIGTMKKRNLQELLFENNLTFSTLKCLLRWPYQYQFMNISQIVFESLNEAHYYDLMQEIISLIIGEKSNNYNQLLEEFWIKSPSRLKKYVIDIESRESDEYHTYHFLIERLFFMGETTSECMQNFYVIVKDTSPVNKDNIFRLQGKYICGELCSAGNFKVADFFFKVLDLNQDIVRAFKKDFAVDFFLRLIYYQRIECVNDEFFKWVLGTDGIDELKDRIFYRLTHTNKIEKLFEFYPIGNNRFAFADKILKLLLRTDEKFEEWKKNILLNVDTPFSPLIKYEYLDWFDPLLTYVGISDEKTSDFKGVLLLRNLPKIAKSLYLGEVFEENILFMCLYKNERIIEFIDALHTFYQDSIRQKMCLLCMNNNLVSSNGDDAQLQCELHGTNGFISLSNVNEICSSFSTRINEALKEHQILIEDSLKRRRNSSISEE